MEAESASPLEDGQKELYRREFQTSLISSFIAGKDKKSLYAWVPHIFSLKLSFIVMFHILFTETHSKTFFYRKFPHFFH